jgi:hypothetical protein
MKLKCTVSWVHSGKRNYYAGDVEDFDRERLDELAAIRDRRGGLAALKFFEPVDDAAKDYIAGLKNGKPKADADDDKAPSKAALVAEAKALGIAITSHTTVGELTAMITEAKAAGNQSANKAPMEA